MLRTLLRLLQLALDFVRLQTILAFLERDRAEHDRCEYADYFRGFRFVDAGRVGDSVLDFFMSLPSNFVQDSTAAITRENAWQIAEYAGVVGVLVGLVVNDLGILRLRRMLSHAAEYFWQRNVDRLLSNCRINTCMLRYLLERATIQLLLYYVKDSAHNFPLSLKRDEVAIDIPN